MGKSYSLLRQSEIEALKIFQRGKDKTQVLLSHTQHKDTIMNRLTHSYIVKTGAEIISNSINDNGINIDYEYAIGNVCLTHDIGHPPFGHMGAEILDKKFKELGIKEGFSDNNNNFVTLKKNGGYRILTDYEIASLIKYPEKLYNSQKKYHLNLLNLMISKDVEYFSKKGITINNIPKRTIACEIMDEADRNAYVCSDLTDCFILEYENEKVIENFMKEYTYNNVEIKNILFSIYEAVKQKEKTLIRFSFNKLFIQLNNNYFIDDDLKLGIKDKELIKFRENLYKLEENIFIYSKEAIKQKEKNMKDFYFYINYVLENEFYPSKTYKNLIINSKTKKEKLTYIRDMIGESTDWFVINTVNKIQKRNEY